MKQYMFFECLMKEEVDETLCHVMSANGIFTTRGVEGGRKIHIDRDAEGNVVRKMTGLVSDGGRFGVENVKEVWESMGQEEDE